MYQSFIYPSLFLNFLPLNLGNFQETIRRILIGPVRKISSSTWPETRNFPSSPEVNKPDAYRAIWIPLRVSSNFRVSGDCALRGRGRGGHSCIPSCPQWIPKRGSTWHEFPATRCVDRDQKLGPASTGSPNVTSFLLVPLRREGRNTHSFEPLRANVA